MSLPVLYLCGPMTGLPKFNYPRFHHAAGALRTVGFTVFNPAENGLPAHAPWHHHMRRDLAHLVRHCAGVATLPGCEDSKGAELELHVATRLGMHCMPVDEWVAFAYRVATNWPRLHRVPGHPGLHGTTPPHHQWSQS